MSAVERDVTSFLVFFLAFFKFYIFQLSFAACHGMSLLSLLLLCALLSLVQCAPGTAVDKALVRITRTNRIFLGILAQYGSRLEDGDKIDGLPIRIPSSTYGCSKWSDIDKSTSHFIAVVDRGNCTFLQKTINAHNAGAQAV